MYVVWLEVCRSIISCDEKQNVRVFSAPREGEGLYPRLRWTLTFVRMLCGDFFYVNALIPAEDN
jgi:hypothetical protein